MRNTDIVKIRSRLDELKGQRVKLYAKGDRNRVTRAVGTLEGVYPSVFTVAVESEGTAQTLSYTYSEMIARRVYIRAADPENDIPSPEKHVLCE